MLHIHFGPGRLGLGLVAPFFKTESSELFLLNRASSGSNPTGSTALGASRRNELLQNHPKKIYLIDTPNGSGAKEVTSPREQVHYNGFFAFEDDTVSETIEQILNNSREKAKAIIVTGSVLTAKNYAPVVEALNVITRTKAEQPDSIGPVYLVACENTVSAYEVLQHDDLAGQIEQQTHDHVRCVHALVDRVCVELEEVMFEGEPTVLARAEEYGSLKLELSPNTEALPDMLKGSRIEFSHHLDVEKEIKSWLLNGSHWLIALTAFQEAGGDTQLKLNDFINSHPNHELYASEVISEMRDGIEALLRSEARYKSFVEEVDVTEYLNGAASAILARFKANDDTIARILARFRAPTPEEVTTVQSFIDRFMGRIEPPLMAYQAEHGTPPKSATQGIFNLFRLQASGTYVDTNNTQETQAA
jgi:hypothetical protein